MKAENIASASSENSGLTVWFADFMDRRKRREERAQKLKAKKKKKNRCLKLRFPVAKRRTSRGVLARLSEHECRVARRDYERGALLTDVAMKFGVSPPRIRRAIVSAGGVIRKRHNQS